MSSARGGVTQKCLGTASIVNTAHRNKVAHVNQCLKLNSSVGGQCYSRLVISNNTRLTLCCCLLRA
jgi:hypothetical protein